MASPSADHETTVYSWYVFPFAVVISSAWRTQTAIRHKTESIFFIMIPFVFSGYVLPSIGNIPRNTSFSKPDSVFFFIFPSFVFAAVILWFSTSRPTRSCHAFHPLGGLQKSPQRRQSPLFVFPFFSFSLFAFLRGCAILHTIRSGCGTRCWKSRSIKSEKSSNRDLTKLNLMLY